MKHSGGLSFFSALIMLCIAPFAYPASVSVIWNGKVDGIQRTALVFPGKDALNTPSPLVLDFHPCCTTAQQVSSQQKIHLAWPEATVVYPQGQDNLWGSWPGEAGDQDLHFVDALLKDLSATYKVDERRVYATGFSAGAYFGAYLLTMRPERFAAFALTGVGDGPAYPNPQVKWVQEARPVLITMGKLDMDVPLAEAERFRSQLLRLNGCGTQTVDWAPGAVSYEPCASGQPLIWSVHEGGHVWPMPVTTNNVVRFFKEHALLERPPAVAVEAEVNATGSVAGSGKAGSSGDNGLATAAKLWFPEGVAVGVEGDLYIADTYNSRVRKVSKDGIITKARGSDSYFPEGIVLDRDGSLFIADTYKQQVRKVAADGKVSMVIGKAELAFPTALAVDSQRNLYIADSDNHRIQMVSADGTITTVAGTGIAGFSGDNGDATAAQLNHPLGLAVDGEGNLFIADSFNHRIRRRSTDGNITTVAGTGTPGFTGDDGTAITAQFNLPTGVAVDSHGNLFIADSLNHRVRRVGVDRVIRTVIGGRPEGGNGTASAIPLHYPSSVAVDAAGSILVADPFHHRVWKVPGLAAPGLIAGQPFPEPKQP